MAEKEEPRRPRGEQFSEPSEYGEAYRHPADHSWNLQILMDLKGAIERLDERTAHVSAQTERLTAEVKGLPTRTAFWTGIASVIAIFGVIAYAYYSGTITTLDALSSRIATLESRFNQHFRH